ncbi:phospholipase D-like domain-containing protein [Enterococcus faecalis]|uniref:phospholipase D-like domain-containing protein n=2 Tax=Enterococcus faecalis TaxID=1351 RepID=UPI00192197A6
MINYKIKDAEFIFSKGRLGFQTVIESFENAKYINVVTYSLSAREDFLIELLHKATIDGIPVKIITNIPGRFNEYFSERNKEKSKKNINAYLDKLNPNKFHQLLSTWFNFSNHSKIVMTDQIAYVGSANYSNLSGENYESGIISRDNGFINHLVREVIPEIESTSLNYFYSKQNEILLDCIIDLLSIEDYIQRVLTDLSKTSYYVTGKNYETGKEFNDCKGSDYDLRWNRLSSVAGVLDFFKDHMDSCYLIDGSEEMEKFKREYKLRVINIQRKVNNICLKLRETLSFNETEFAMEMFERNRVESQIEDRTSEYISFLQDLSYEEKILSKYDLKKDLIFLLDSIVEYLDAICWAKKRIKNFIESDNRTNTEIDDTLTSENKC